MLHLHGRSVKEHATNELNSVVEEVLEEINQ